MGMAVASSSDMGAIVVVLCADGATRDVLAFWLRATGLNVATANNGAAARAHLDRASARLLITDRVLPPWPGLDTMVGLKQSRNGLTIAFLDDGLPDSRALARSAGADMVLPWPLRRANVIDACRTAEAIPGDKPEGVACAS